VPYFVFTKNKEIKKKKEAKAIDAASTDRNCGYIWMRKCLQILN
jgi:hypothetical protein